MRARLGVLDGPGQPQRGGSITTAVKQPPTAAAPQQHTASRRFAQQTHGNIRTCMMYCDAANQGTADTRGDAAANAYRQDTAPSPPPALPRTPSAASTLCPSAPTHTNAQPSLCALLPLRARRRSRHGQEERHELVAAGRRRLSPPAASPGPSDALGNDGNAAAWLLLAHGLRGDPTYLAVNNQGSLDSYVNALRSPGKQSESRSTSAAPPELTDMIEGVAMLNKSDWCGHTSRSHVC